MRKIVREWMCIEFQEVSPTKDIVFDLVETRAVSYWSRHVRRHVLGSLLVRKLKESLTHVYHILAHVSFHPMIHNLKEAVGFAGLGYGS